MGKSTAVIRTKKHSFVITISLLKMDTSKKIWTIAASQKATNKGKTKNSRCFVFSHFSQLAPTAKGSIGNCSICLSKVAPASRSLQTASTSKGQRECVSFRMNSVDAAHAILILLCGYADELPRCYVTVLCAR